MFRVEPVERQQGASQASRLYVMGLLDDAIREHLDLKRRRGADPAEVERLEREALGPVRRGSEADERAPAGEADLEHDEDELEPELDARFEEESNSEPPNTPAAHAGLGEPPPYDGSPETQAPLEPQPEAPQGPSPPPTQKSPLPGHTDQPPEHDVVAEHDSAAGEDVLEETPEFLQDAPDHDRLWFEQRPPRDFDFDG
jgi:hypothetical protein